MRAQSERDLFIANSACCRHPDVGFVDLILIRKPRCKRCELPLNSIQDLSTASWGLIFSIHPPRIPRPIRCFGSNHCLHIDFGILIPHCDLERAGRSNDLTTLVQQCPQTRSLSDCEGLKEA